MGSHQDRICMFYLRDGLVKNKLGKAVKYSLVQIYYTDNSYLFFTRHAQKFTDCIETDLTISVAIDRQNCDRLYSRIRPLGRSHEHM